MKGFKWLSSMFRGFRARSAGESAGFSASRLDTEFTAEIVRVTQVLPHPNADRLEIIRFELKDIGETTYEVVSQKGSFKVGDLAAYFSVDCILPTSHPDFEFLTKRPDGQGKTHFRLRAARLRGVFSQGLLVPCPAGMSFGEGCADAFGVTYYRAPEPEANGTAPSPKPRPQPFPIYGVDSLKKMPRLFEEGEPVLVTEKIHGCNFRFGWVRRRFLGIPFGWKFVVGSHRVIKGDGSSGYYDEDVWLDAAERMKLAEKTRDYRGFVFYGELYGYTYGGKRIQDLTYGRIPESGPGLACFDIRSPNGQWLNHFEREWVLTDCDLPSVPVVYAGPFHTDTIRRFAEGESIQAKLVPYRPSNGRDAYVSGIEKGQIREGVVVESIEGPRRKAKYVGEGYLTRKDA